MGDTDPPSQAQKEAFEGRAKRTPSQGGWRRALLPPARRQTPRVRNQGCEDPLSPDSTKAAERYPGQPLQLPAEGGPSIWDTVDAAIHRAFCDDLIMDRSLHLELSELVESLEQ